MTIYLVIHIENDFVFFTVPWVSLGQRKSAAALAHVVDPLDSSVRNCPIGRISLAELSMASDRAIPMIESFLNKRRESDVIYEKKL